MSNNNFTRRVSGVSEAVTLAMSSIAKTMQREGREVYNLSAGIPQIDTPEFIKEGAIEALMQGKTKYSHVSGELLLKEAIVTKVIKVTKRKSIGIK